MKLIRKEIFKIVFGKLFSISEKFTWSRMPRISPHIYIVYVIYNIKNDNIINMTVINKYNIIIVFMQLVETLGLSWKSGYRWNCKMYVHCLHINQPDWYMVRLYWLHQGAVLCAMLVFSVLTTPLPSSGSSPSNS